MKLYPGDQHWLSIGLLALLAAGCSPPAASVSHVPADAASKPSGRAQIAAQLAEVERGASDQILIDDAPLGDDDLALLSKFAKSEQRQNLHVLLLDGPGNRLTDGAIAHLAGLASLEHLRLRGAAIGDAGLTQIAASLPNLRILNLPQAQFSDAGLAELGRLPKLEQLRFGSPSVTDAGIAKLPDFPELKRVHLIDVPITAAALQTFAAMPRLESLYLDGAPIGDEAFEQLFAARPKLHVHLGQLHHDLDPHKNDHSH
jgi:hypothetical protein